MLKRQIVTLGTGQKVPHRCSRHRAQAAHHNQGRKEKGGSARKDQIKSEAVGGILPQLRPTESGSLHLLQAGGKLRVFLRNFELRSSGFSIGQCIDNLALGSGEFRSALKVFEGLDDLSLLQEELGHCSNGDVALGVNYNPG